MREKNEIMRREWKRTADDRRRGGVRGRSRRGLVRNQQVVVVLQERGGEREITRERRRERERERASGAAS